MGNASNSGEMLLRQWLILKKIPQYPKKITTSSLMQYITAEGIDISRRTLERDLDDLSRLFPILADKSSKPYGWSWQRYAQIFSIPAMAPLQALTLSLAKEHLTHILPANLLNALAPYFDYANQVLLSGNNVNTLAKWKNKVALAPAQQPMISPKYANDVLDTVHDALMNDRQLSVRYASRSKRKSENLTLHPLGLVQRGLLIYLVATINQYKDARILALHRIKEAVLLKDKADTPKAFSLKEYVDSGAFGFKGGGKIALYARFKAHAAKHLIETPLSKDQKLTEKDGFIDVRATVIDNSQLRWWLLGFGNDVEVMEPAHLRQEFAEKAQAMALMYQEK